MTTPTLQFKRRNSRSDKRLRLVKKMAAMRAAKERKRLERANAGYGELPPRGKIVRYPHLSWAMRDDLSGDVVWMPLISIRDMAKRAGMVARFYQPTLRK